MTRETQQRSRGEMFGRVFAILCLVSLALGTTSCKKETADDPRTQPDMVKVTHVAAPAEDSQLFTGVVTARVESDLGFRVSGKVVRRLVDVGQTVQAGQTLMQIDLADYANAITTQAETVAAQSQTVAAAKVRADQTAADERRYRGLVKTGAVSASTYDQIKAAADAAKAQLASAEAQVAALQAQEKIARNQGDYSLLLADSDGTVVETLAEPGQVVAAGQVVIKVAQAGPREAAIFLPETIRPAVGSPAQAVLFGDSSSGTSAELRQLSDSADPLTRTFEARYVLSGKAASAPLGATVSVRIASPKALGAEMVPIAAITDRGKGPGVWMIDTTAATVSFRPVKIVRMGSEDAYLDGGVHVGDEIVALGAHLLSDGQHVRFSADPDQDKGTASR
jgi:RND family efflux transporter MFP subunit